VIYCLGEITVQKFSINFEFALAFLWQGFKKYPFFVKRTAGTITTTATATTTTKTGVIGLGKKTDLQVAFIKIAIFVARVLRTNEKTHRDGEKTTATTTTTAAAATATTTKNTRIH